MSASCRIVSLCGSAGALPGLYRLPEKISSDSGMTFVVLTHRREHPPGWLVEILSKVTGMHVEEIIDGTVFQANNV